MTHIQDLLAQPACRALGWALLHFLWQGSLAALLLAGCNLALRDSSARIRYGVSCLFLMLLLALPVLTLTASLVHAPALAATPADLAIGIPAARPQAGGDSLTTPLLELLLELRTRLRKDKHFTLADEIRNRLTALGVILEDRPDGTKWRIEPRR